MRLIANAFGVTADVELVAPERLLAIAASRIDAKPSINNPNSNQKLPKTISESTRQTDGERTATEIANKPRVNVFTMTRLFARSEA